MTDKQPETLGDRVADEHERDTKAAEREMTGGKTPPVETGGDIEDKYASDLRESTRKD